MSLEKGKLVRQLSLVSYLMAMNRPVTARDVRESVEGYSEMKDDAFARRFYADRTELIGLGVPLKSNRDDDTGEELYTLSEKQYFLPPLELTEKELTALHSCLSLLDGQFAYAEPLRLALQNLTLGRENPAQDPALASTTIRLVGSDYSAEVANRISKLETAITRRRTVTFDYYTMGRDEEAERVVDPYSLIWNGGQWYLIGHSHERNDIRVFRLTRIRGDIRFTSRRERDFDIPEDFDASAYRTRPSWQLGGDGGTADLHVDANSAWWVARSFGQAGRVRKLRDGSAVFSTAYSGVRWLSSWVCGMNGHVVPLGPGELVNDVLASLNKIAEAHTGEPVVAAAPVVKVAEDDPAAAQTLARRRRNQRPVVSTEQFAMLQALMADLLASCDEKGEGRVPADKVKERYGLDDRGLEDAVSLLTLINFGAGAYAMYAELQGDTVLVETWPDGAVFEKPARLSPLEAKALMLALDLVGPLIAATAQSELEPVREKLKAAFGGYGEPTVPETEPCSHDQRQLQQLTTAIREQRVLSIEYWSQSRGELTTRSIEALAIQRLKSHWYIVAWCRKADDVRSFRLDRVKKMRLMRSTFEPRDVDLSGYQADTPTSLDDDPKIARVLFSPDVARWIIESRPDAQVLVDGSAVLDLPTATDEWIIEEILKYRGLATVLAPAELRDRVRQSAKRVANTVKKIRREHAELIPDETIAGETSKVAEQAQSSDTNNGDRALAGVS